MNRIASLLMVFLLFSSFLAAEEVVGYYPGDVALWERMFWGTPPLKQPEGRAVAGILPHHDIDLVTMGRYYRSLNAQPSVVVLLSPNHFEWSDRAFVLPQYTVFSTTDGPLNSDEGLVERLARSLSERATLTSEAWSIEHGVFTHAPFIKRFFPRARFVPILVKMGADFSDLRDLVQILLRELPPDALLLGSVDFSHYQIAPVAHYHDLSTAAAIRNFEVERMLTREVDSPESLLVVTQYSLARGASGTQVALTSSGEFSKNPLSETTSHQYWTFVPGPPRPERRVTLVAGGRLDRPGDWGLALDWVWDRYRTSIGVRAELDLLAGKESRFLNGFDAYLFGSLPRLTETAIGGVRCAFVGWTDEPFSRQLAAIKRLTGAEFVAVVADTRPFREEELLQLSVAGVDLVVDRAMEARQPLLVGKMLSVTSLGDLTAVGDGIGTLLMASWRPDDWESTTFDVIIRQGRPQPIHQFGFPTE